jgi:hypothetical protein
MNYRGTVRLLEFLIWQAAISQVLLAFIQFAALADGQDVQ